MHPSQSKTLLEEPVDDECCKVECRCWRPQERVLQVAHDARVVRVSHLVLQVGELCLLLEDELKIKHS